MDAAWIKLINKKSFGYLIGCFALFIVISVIMQMTYSGTPQRIPLVLNVNLRTFWMHLHKRRTTSVPYCCGLIQHNKTAVEKALAYMKTNQKEVIGPDSFAQLKTNDCEKFRTKSGYITEALSKKEANFPLAFSIIMYKDVEQTERLLRAIYMPQNYYCIHVDKKSPKNIHQAMAAIAACLPHVFIASVAQDIRWGEHTMLRADLGCMKDLLRYKDWWYFINLTGQEWPLVTNRNIVDMLAEMNNTNLIGSEIETGKEFITRTKYSWKGSQCLYKPKTAPPFDIKLTKGSLHHLVTRDFVNFVINNEVPRRFLDWLNDTWAPEETFFASLHHNKRLKVPGSQRDPPVSPRYRIRHVVWTGNALGCQGKWVRDVCITGVGDVRNVVTSGGLFVNKFHLDFQPLALDCVEEFQRNKTMKLLAASKGGAAIAAA